MGNLVCGGAVCQCEEHSTYLITAWTTAIPAVRRKEVSESE